MKSVRARLAQTTLLVLAVTGCGPTFVDPEGASCAVPEATFGEPMVVADHSDISVGFTCEGATLSGALYMPVGNNPHPAVVWAHGQEKPRGSPTGFPFSKRLWSPV